MAGSDLCPPRSTFEAEALVLVRLTFAEKTRSKTQNFFSLNNGVLWAHVGPGGGGGARGRAAMERRGAPGRRAGARARDARLGRRRPPSPAVSGRRGERSVTAAASSAGAEQARGRAAAASPPGSFSQRLKRDVEVKTVRTAWRLVDRQGPLLLLNRRHGGTRARHLAGHEKKEKFPTRRDLHKQLYLFLILERLSQNEFLEINHGIKGGGNNGGQGVIFFCSQSAEGDGAGGEEPPRGRPRFLGGDRAW